MGYLMLGQHPAAGDDDKNSCKIRALRFREPCTWDAAHACRRRRRRSLRRIGEGLKQTLLSHTYREWGRFIPVWSRLRLQNLVL